MQRPANATRCTFSADIAFEFYPGSPPPVVFRKARRFPTSILTPRLTPDGKSVIFTAAGYLWRQSLSGGAAERLLDTGGFEWGPAALSPDGKKLAYQLSEGDTQQLRIVDLATGQSSTLDIGRSNRALRACLEPRWHEARLHALRARSAPLQPEGALRLPGRSRERQAAEACRRFPPLAASRPVFGRRQVGVLHRQRTSASPLDRDDRRQRTDHRVYGLRGEWAGFARRQVACLPSQRRDLGGAARLATDEGRGRVPLLAFGRAQFQLHARRYLARLLDGGRRVAPSA